jgi:hypothetical protein
LTAIFSKFKQYAGFEFWVIDKHGDKTDKSAPAIIYSKNNIGAEGDVVNALRAKYNTEQITKDIL